MNIAIPVLNHEPSQTIKDPEAVYFSHDKSMPGPGIDIEITGNRISRIGANLSPLNAHIISAKNCVAFPGPANTHHHFFQVLTRAIPLMQNMPLFEWLTLHYPVWEGLTDIETYHDPSRDSMQRIALAPCSPFSVSGCLKIKTAELACRHNVRLHMYPAETLDEQDYCLQRFRCRPVELMRKLGWI